MRGDKTLTRKFEISKEGMRIWYTGEITKEDDRWITIETIKNEVVTFRREQVLQIVETRQNDKRKTI